MPVECWHHDTARHPLSSVREEQSARVANGTKSGAGHLKDAEFVGGPETMLHRTKQSKCVVAIALEGQHGVDDMLERTWAG